MNALNAESHCLPKQTSNTTRFDDAFFSFSDSECRNLGMQINFPLATVLSLANANKCSIMLATANKI